ncbi:MAG TPA: class I SAM-dependent methyltransferase [Flavisolibacter sp.]|nr:class I SAM-dependent methyltransferase [Flavisolibacter sp.]
MEQPFDKFLMFSNRLTKVYRHLSRQAKRLNISCYRVYDHDIPEFPFLIEIYEGKLYVSEYKRRHNLSEDEHEAWLEKCKELMTDILSVDQENIFFKVRQRKTGRLGQYQKIEEERTEFIVHENGLKFIVNLSDYLDTGLFLDHRITRQMVKDISAGKKVLNLFCYTGSFSVYAAAGNALNIVSVDLSKTYLKWAERNLELNFPDFNQHEEIHADVKEYLKTLGAESFDLIIMDPPTFSNSKRMDDFLDIQRDHVELINDCLRILSPAGSLFFSTNYTKFVLDVKNISSSAIKDMTKATTPFDFSDTLKRQCFLIDK